MAPDCLRWVGTAIFGSKLPEGLDKSGRLVRGRTYANNGSLQNIAFESNKIAARVKVSIRAAYKIAFKIDPLSGADKARLVSSLLR